MVARLGLHIHLDRIVDDAARPAVIEIAARFQHARIPLVDISFSGRCVLLEQGKVADMVPMPMGRGDHLDIGSLEAKRLNVGFNQRIGTRRARIDQDQACPGVDQIVAEIISADIVHVANDLESGKRRLPFLVRDRQFHALLRQRPRREHRNHQ